MAAFVMFYHQLVFWTSEGYVNQNESEFAFAWTSKINQSQ
jgi:hypothetical protein